MFWGHQSLHYISTVTHKSRRRKRVYIVLCVYLQLYICGLHLMLQQSHSKLTVFWPLHSSLFEHTSAFQHFWAGKEIMNTDGLDYLTVIYCMGLLGWVQTVYNHGHDQSASLNHLTFNQFNLNSHNDFVYITLYCRYCWAPTPEPNHSFSIENNIKAI